ncbi:hypothetical protein [uncultured Tessaracoccus sp.]|uniref:hypothetical protein n=1 Tax=uncultured Tessaracoccus sp. TaxID=905023 RepID=UPI0025DC7EF4|nr:hypothetical protein [uncultured Tessaracoccus sp.]
MQEWWSPPGGPPGLAEAAPGRTTDVPLLGPTGEEDAVVTLDSTGMLVGIELLNASVQLPRPGN